MPNSNCGVKVGAFDSSSVGTYEAGASGDEVVVNFDLENCVERRLFGAHAAPKLRHFDARRMLEEIAYCATWERFSWAADAVSESASADANDDQQ